MAKQLRLGTLALKYVCPSLSLGKAKELSVDLTHAMHEYDITTRLRAAAFIAQTAHESGEYRWVEELASGSEYEGRGDLGNIIPGDGRRFKGRGYIQITGRTNYRAVGVAFHPHESDIYVRHPELLANRTNAALSAAWWWKNHGLNRLADKEMFVAITRTINGGTNGLPDRQKYYKRALRVSKYLVPEER